MFVGEAPGAQEDAEGRPFVGAAGQFLDRLLHGIGWPRSAVFIANIVKHRPPGNRDPQPDEIEACFDYLLAQIAIIQPKVICTLGRFAMRKLLGDDALSISRVHGTRHRRSGIWYVPLYHPAAALHQESLRGAQVEDFGKLDRLLREVGVAPPPS
jgi:DNA polymerase